MALKPTPDAALRGSNIENVFARASVLPWVLRLLNIGPILILILLAIIVSFLKPINRLLIPALPLSPKKTWQNSTKAIRMTVEAALWPVPPINFLSEAGLLREFY